MKRLPRLSKSGILTPSQWEGVARVIEDNFREATLQPGVGYTVTNSPGGASLVVKAGAGAAAVASGLPFQLIVTTDPADTSSPPAPMIRVIPSSLAGGSMTDLGFSLGDDPPYFLEPTEGLLVGGITWGTSDGQVTSRWLEILTELPAAEDGTDYVEIGTVHWASDDSAAGGKWVVTNTRYGPVYAIIFRDWGAASPPYFRANFPNTLSVSAG
jgi:hypothetical protein